MAGKVYILGSKQLEIKDFTYDGKEIIVLTDLQLGETIILT